MFSYLEGMKLVEGLDNPTNSPIPLPTITTPTITTPTITTPTDTPPLINGSRSNIIADIINKFVPPDNSYRTWLPQFNGLTFVELGEEKNEKFLNKIESIILKFLDLSDKEVITFYNGKKLSNESIDLTFNDLGYLLKNIHNIDTGGNNIKNIHKVLNRLLKHVPDILQKIVNGLKGTAASNGDDSKYLVIDTIIHQLFKYNTTNVNLDFFSGFKSIMNYLKGLQTIEMVIAIISIAFVLSKVFDMFKVNVAI